MSEETVEFKHYRALYIRAINEKIFPWESAYYYYLETTDDIDVFPFQDFKDSLMDENAQCSSYEEAFNKVTVPIYRKLDEFYNPHILLSKENEILRMC